MATIVVCDVCDERKATHSLDGNVAVQGVSLHVNANFLNVAATNYIDVCFKCQIQALRELADRTYPDKG